MSKRPDQNLVVGLDIGTSKVACIVAESSGGELEIIGLVSRLPDAIRSEQKWGRLVQGWGRKMEPTQRGSGLC